MTDVLETTKPFDLSLLLEDHVAGVRFTDGRNTYRTEKPMHAYPMHDGMLRVYTNDGVAHTQRRWYGAIIIDYEDGSSREFDTGEPFIDTNEVTASLLPEGVTRTIGAVTGVFRCPGRIWFHYGPMIGFSIYGDLGDGFGDMEGYTYVNSQNTVYWWRDE